MKFQIQFPTLFLALAGLWLASCASAPRSTAASNYSHRMHNRFYEAWVQPPSVAAPRGKISVPVDVQIDARGRVESFVIAKSSGNAAIDASIRQAGRKVSRVAPPPLDSSQARFNLRIFFELDVRH